MERRTPLARRCAVLHSAPAEACRQLPKSTLTVGCESSDLSVLFPRVRTVEPSGLSRASENSQQKEAVKLPYPPGAAMVMLFGLARRAARQIEKVSLFYEGPIRCLCTASGL